MTLETFNEVFIFYFLISVKVKKKMSHRHAETILGYICYEFKLVGRSPSNDLFEQAYFAYFGMKLNDYDKSFCPSPNFIQQLMQFELEDNCRKNNFIVTLWFHYIIISESFQNMGILNKEILS